ncbi:MAG TPA: vitamin K epoxide reductase family protein [Terriglobales bacterium]
MRYILAILAIAGVIVSGMALREHYRTEPAPCAINDQWDCGAVNHSPFAVIFNVPVAIIGIAGYLALAALALMRRRALMLGAAVIGLCFALRLSYVEAYILETWCIYCVISQTIIALITLLAAGWTIAGAFRKKQAEAPAS